MKVGYGAARSAKLTTLPPSDGARVSWERLSFAGEPPGRRVVGFLTSRPTMADDAQGMGKTAGNQRNQPIAAASVT